MTESKTSNEFISDESFLVGNAEITKTEAIDCVILWLRENIDRFALDLNSSGSLNGTQISLSLECIYVDDELSQRHSMNIGTILRKKFDK